MKGNINVQITSVTLTPASWCTVSFAGAESRGSAEQGGGGSIAEQPATLRTERFEGDAGRLRWVRVLRAMPQITLATASL